MCIGAYDEGAVETLAFTQRSPGDMMACNASEYGIYIRFVLLAAVLTFTGACTNSQLSREDIKIAAADIRSYAAAARLLAEQHRSASTTDFFFRSQTDMLGEKVDDERKALEASGGENEVYRLKAHDVADRLDSFLASSPDEAGLTRCLADAHALEETLDQ
jgi:hypothetical protein